MSNWYEYHDEFRKFIMDYENDAKNEEAYEYAVHLLCDVRYFRGRCFILGMGGSAANAQHLANDMRKMCNIDAISLSDNIAELTARANDDGFTRIYLDSLKASNLDEKDAVFILSVSGGSREKEASLALVHAMDLAHERNCSMIGIVGMEDSVAAKYRSRLEHTAIMVTPKVDKYQTQFAEAAQSVIWHGLISDPRMMQKSAKW
jgi:D-sedoheptulose 7-phosphate isomerase